MSGTGSPVASASDFFAHHLPGEPTAAEFLELLLLLRDDADVLREAAVALRDGAPAWRRRLLAWRLDGNRPPSRRGRPPADVEFLRQFYALLADGHTREQALDVISAGMPDDLDRDGDAAKKMDQRARAAFKRECRQLAEYLDAAARAAFPD